MSLREPRCLVCGAPLALGAPFEKDVRKSEVCSDKCYEIYMHNEDEPTNEKEEVMENKETLRMLGERASIINRMYDKEVCVVCGESVDNGQAFCSEACELYSHDESELSRPVMDDDDEEEVSMDDDARLRKVDGQWECRCVICGRWKNLDEMCISPRKYIGGHMIYCEKCRTDIGIIGNRLENNRT